MKIIALSLVLVGILGFAVYMSGGMHAFFANLLSTRTTSESETIALDVPNERIQNATVSAVASAKLPAKTHRNTKIASSAVSSSAARISDVPTSSPAAQILGMPHIVISELMTGIKGNSNYDFVELYNDSAAPALLTGVSIKKKSGSGKESSLVAESRFAGKTIPAHGYFLLANEKGYTGAVTPDAVWPSSYSLAAAKNGVVLYENGKAVDAVYWDAIPDGMSIVRDGWGIAAFHTSATPTPQSVSHF